MKNRARYHTFAKAQSAALIATALDFALYVVLVEWFAVWYVMAAGLAALAGAICNFMLGRHWCFCAGNGHLTTQGLRYLLVASASLVLNTSGIYALTEFMAMHYITSKVIIAILVAIFFNFPLQRHYVFKSA